MAKIIRDPTENITNLYPAPVVLVTCGHEQPNIITLAWVGTLCSEPILVGIGVRPSRYSHDLIKTTGEFAVNIPTADMVEIVDYCGHVSGRDVDKFVACSLTPEPASAIKTPLIAQCPINLECKVVQTISLGTHDLFIGEVVAAQVEENSLDEEGHIDYEKAKVFVIVEEREYRGLGDLLGLYHLSISSQREGN